MITDGKSPINLFNTAHGLIGSTMEQKSKTSVIFTQYNCLLNFRIKLTSYLVPCPKHCISNSDITHTYGIMIDVVVIYFLFFC